LLDGIEHTRNAGLAGFLDEPDRPPGDLFQPGLSAAGCWRMWIKALAAGQMFGLA